MYGFGGTNFIISEHTSIGTITNSIDAVARAAALAANGMGGAVASGGDNTLKTKITINNKTLEVNGADLSAVDKIELTHAMSKIQFNAAMEVDSDIYDPGGRSLGIVQVSADTIFNGNIGQNGAAGAVIYQVIVDDTINTTFQSSVIRATELVLDNDSHIIINPVNNSVLIAAAINTTEAPGDLLGKITINPDAVNTVIFNDEIGGIDERVKKIKITDGLGAVTFREDVFAKQIKVGAANVTFEKAVNLVNSTLALGNADKQGLLNFTADGTVSLSAATFKGDISTKTNNEGTLIYNDLAKAGGVPTKVLGGRIVTGLNNLKGLHFSKAGSQIQLSAADIGAGEIKLLAADQLLFVDDNINYAGRIKGNAKVRFDGRSQVNWLGENGARLAEVIAGAGAITFNQPIYADKMDIVAGGNVRIATRTISANNIYLRAGSNINFVNGLDAAVAIENDAPGSGTVTYSANGMVGSVGTALSPTQAVIFANNAQHTLHSNIYSNNITFDAGVFIPNADNIVITGGAIVGANNLGALWHAQDANTIITAAEAARLAGIEAARLAEVARVRREAVVVVEAIREIERNAPEAQRVAKVAAAINTYQPDVAQEVLRTAAAEVQIEHLGNLAQGSSTVQDVSEQVRTLENSIENNNLNQPVSETIRQQIETIESPILTAKNLNKVIEDFEAKNIIFSNSFATEAFTDTKTSARTVAEQAILYVASEQQLTTSERKKDKASQDTASEQSKILLEQVNDIITSTVSSRVDDISIDLVSGLSSGDDDHKILTGVWASGLYGVNKQDSNNNRSGYKGNVAGGTIGVDFNISADILAGISYSNVASNIKFKDTLAGNKLEGTSHIASIYAHTALTDKLSLQSTFAIGKNNISTKRLQSIGGGETKVATGKLDNTSYIASASASYIAYANNNFSILPTIGLRYGYYKDGKFKETGVGVHNIEIASKSSSDLTGILGTKIAYHMSVSEDTTIIPSLSLAVEQKLKSDQAKVKAKLSWMENYFENDPSLNKSTKTSYNIGANVLAQHKNIELTAGYNLVIKKKFQSHQGSVKLRLQF